MSNLNRRYRFGHHRRRKSRETRFEGGASSINLAWHNHRTKQYSITALTDSSGTIQERYAYDSYGNLSIFDGAGSSLSATAEGNRYTYTGREWDGELGLYHFRARIYDSMTGRFCGRDPIGYNDGFNRYSLVSRLNETDPSGLIRIRPNSGHSGSYPKPKLFRKKNKCAVTMLDHDGTNHSWERELNQLVGYRVKSGIRSRDELAAWGKLNNCCCIVAIGHQGDIRGVRNKGGLVTYPDPFHPYTPVIIFPSQNNRLPDTKSFHQRLFNHCESCKISMFACGGESDQHIETRRRIANETGCQVCGSRKSIVAGGRNPMDGEGPNVTLGKGRIVRAPRYKLTWQEEWDPDCVSPSVSFLGWLGL